MVEISNQLKKRWQQLEDDVILDSYLTHPLHLPFRNFLVLFGILGLFLSFSNLLE